MERVPEPDLMNGQAQVLAYSEADFAEPHEQFVEAFRRVFAHLDVRGVVADLGCGPADVTVRFARAFPRCRIEGIDGAPRMLAEGRRRIAREGLSERVTLMEGYLPDTGTLREDYAAVISNSLLHHLKDPHTLWATIGRITRPGTPVLVMDLMRPQTREAAAALVEQYAAGEPDVLREDFYNSLCAAYRPAEVQAQLAAAGLSGLEVEACTDRHLVAFGLT